MSLPTIIFGKNAEEAYQRYLKGDNPPPAPAPKPAQPSVPPADIQEPEKYIVLPGRVHREARKQYSYPDLLVSMEKYHHGKNWNQAHEELSKEDAFMLTIRQHEDLVELLKSGNVLDGIGNKINAARITQILEDIIATGNWRAEWLDGKFEDKNGVMWMHYNHKFVNNGVLVPQNSAQLYTHLNEDCYVDVNFNSQGLPTVKSKTQSYVKGDNIYHYYPRNGAVAWFVAGSDRAFLYCFRVASYSVAVLGVRRAKILQGVAKK